MIKIESQSDRSAHPVRSFFVPSLSSGVLFCLLGAMLLAIYSSSSITRWLGNSYLGSAGRLALNIKILDSGLSHSFSTAFGGRLGQIIVWSLIGAVAYIALWFFKNLLNRFENDIIIDHYLHPANYNRAGYWGHTAAGIIFFAASLIVFLAYTYFGLRVIMPAAASLTASAGSHFHLPGSPIYILLCVLIGAVSIYIWTLLAKTIGHLWKLM